jgi:hypothetical protein
MATIKTKGETPAEAPPADDWANDGETAPKDAAKAPEKASEVEEDYVYVTMPDGATRAIPRSVVDASQARNKAALAAAGITSATPAEDAEVYVWLADGSVERVKTSELPGSAGTNAVNGHWERDGQTFQIVNVYPVESESPKESSK